MPQTTHGDTPLPPPVPPQELRHRTNVHGTVFAARQAVVDRLQRGQALLLVPDPPQEEEAPAVWVHVAGGDVLGHLPVQVAAWLAPWMLHGGRARASVVQVHGDDVASWHRIEIEVERQPTPADPRHG